MTDPRNLVKNPGVATVDDVARVVYENARDELRQPSPVWDLPHGGPTSLRPEEVRWLRGRVVVELHPDIVSDVLVIPNGEDRDRRVGPAAVVAMGPPAQIRCAVCRRRHRRGEEDKQIGVIICPSCGPGAPGWVDQPYGFEVGALVYVVLPHKSRAIEMDGRNLHVVAQSEVELWVGR